MSDSGDGTPSNLMLLSVERSIHDATTTVTSSDVVVTSSHADGGGVIDVPVLMLILAATPLFGLAGISRAMDWRLESQIVVGVIRTFLQLLTLGSILRPIFVWGMHHILVVLGYVFLMTLLASMESLDRTKYYFDHMVWCVLAAFILNVGVVAVFAFGVIIQPDPVWNPQYVIPIAGMLLGNCISGVGLASNALLTDLVEHSTEVELFLSFGAQANEASSRLVREAVRVGTMPMLNSMRVIGIIAIPGMMTGQILAGSNPFVAAKYQILICNLIGICAFGTIFVQVWIARRVALDPLTGMMRTYRLKKTPTGVSFLGRVGAVCAWMNTFVWNGFLQLKSCCCGGSREAQPLLRPQPIKREGSEDMGWNYQSDASMDIPADLLASGNGYESTAPTGRMEILTIKRGPPSGALAGSDGPEQQPVLELTGISRSFDGTGGGKPRTLFRDISLRLYPGDVVAVSGPSGVGKSQLLRVMGALTPVDSQPPRDSVEGDGSLWESSVQSDMKLLGSSFREWNQGLLQHSSASEWRRKVRYVSQYKVDITGTPKQFIKRVASFESWRKQRAITKAAKEPSTGIHTDNEATSQSHTVPSTSEMLSVTLKLIQKWGMDASFLDKEWKVLSGGEAQRMYVAIAVASRPRVLLLDESTSALDLASKKRVEESVEAIASEQGMCVVWISHDQEQLQRLKGNHK